MGVFWGYMLWAFFILALSVPALAIILHNKRPKAIEHKLPPLKGLQTVRDRQDYMLEGEQFSNYDSDVIDNLVISNHPIRTLERRIDDQPLHSLIRDAEKNATVAKRFETEPYDLLGWDFTSNGRKNITLHEGDEYTSWVKRRGKWVEMEPPVVEPDDVELPADIAPDAMVVENFSFDVATVIPNNTHRVELFVPKSKDGGYTYPNIVLVGNRYKDGKLTDLHVVEYGSPYAELAKAVHRLSSTYAPTRCFPEASKSCRWEHKCAGTWVLGRPDHCSFYNHGGYHPVQDILGKKFT